MPSTKLGVNGVSTSSPRSSDGLSGAPVLISTATILTSERVALIAAAIPAQSPPPPHGTSTVSTSGRSSRISRPITPFPASTSGSLNGWMKTPSMPGYSRVWKISIQSLIGAFTTRPPKRSTAAILVSGAVSGTTTVHETPSLRADQATPCAMLPALAVQTPASSASGPAASMALLAPRSLNEPIGCSNSSLR